MQMERGDHREKLGLHKLSIWGGGKVSNSLSKFVCYLKSQTERLEKLAEKGDLAIGRSSRECDSKLPSMGIRGRGFENAV